jgi:AraC-like DNA-binding protein
VLRKTTDGGYYVLDGNHRGTAAKNLGVDQVEAWVVTCGEDQAYMIAMLANVARHGQGITREARMNVCMNLVQRGYNIDQVARAANVRPGTVKTYVRDTQMSKRWQTIHGRPLVTSGKKVEQLARFADSELEVIGADAVKAPTNDLKRWAQELNALDPAQRLTKAH